MVSRIIVDNGSYHLRNMGDVCMLQHAAQRLADLFPEAELAIPTTNTALLARYVGGTPLNASSWRGWSDLRIFPLRYAWLPNRSHEVLRKAEKRLKAPAPIASTSLGLFWRRINREPTQISVDGVKDFLNADLLVACGGGYLTDRFRSHANGILDSLELAQAAKIPTALLGQGIGPVCDHQLLERMETILPRVDLIALREGRVGHSLLQSLGVPGENIIVTGDDAIEPAFEQRSPELGRDIGFNLRTARYAQVDSEAAQEVFSLVEQATRQYKTQLRPIPIDWLDNPDSDVATLGRLFGDDQNVIWPKEDTPLAVIRQVGQCRIVVTGSYHAGVFALAQGVPIIAITRSQYYADKFAGLAEQFGRGCRVLSLDDDSFEENLQESIDEAWNSANAVRESLLNAARRQIEQSQEVYGRLQQVNCV